MPGGSERTIVVSCSATLSYAMRSSSFSLHHTVAVECGPRAVPARSGCERARARFNSDTVVRLNPAAPGPVAVRLVQTNTRPHPETLRRESEIPASRTPNNPAPRPRAR